MIRALVAAILFAASLQAQARRLVLVKVDGLPADRVEALVNQIDPATGQSVLPWMHSIFLEHGAWVRNFYVRGISLSAPSWSMLDTGQHLTIRGNAEFDRFIPRVYDYLNFFPFYTAYAEHDRVDMPPVEVLDQFGVPLLLDSFAPDARQQSMQLFQRGVRWSTLKGSITNRVVRPVRDLLNEWETGFELATGVDEQEEGELIRALANPKILYLDLYLGDYDHTAHLTNDEASQLTVLKRLDARLGRIWTAIQASPLAGETILVLVSDHGMNSTPGTLSQGYSLVKFFNSVAGGGHHVVTVRHPMTEFKIKGLDPFVSWVVTPSGDSTYLRNQASYPTALIDPDGNERASVQLRNSDLNAIHILLAQLKRRDLSAVERVAIWDGVLKLIERNRARWFATSSQLNQELMALRRTIDRTKANLGAEPKKPKQDPTRLRVAAALDTWQRDERGYAAYVNAIQRLLDLKDSDADPARVQAETLIPKGVMGEPNSLGQLQNYVTGLSKNGFVIDENGSLDLDRSFTKVNYFAMLANIRVRNVVQHEVGATPVDFTAVRVPAGALAQALPAADHPDSDAVFLYGGDRHEALVLSQMRKGGLWLRYLPVRDLTQDAGGEIRFSETSWTEGFPLHLFEDPNLCVSGDRTDWLSAWHSEREWLDAIHRTRYSNGVIGITEMFQRWQPESLGALFEAAEHGGGFESGDAALLRRFVGRRRELTEADLLIFAADHWNFNVRDFNPGGNHGSFLRISTHSVLMAAGGGIPQGLPVETPYDSLSFVPTLLKLIGRLPEPSSYPSSYPGPVIEELTRRPISAPLSSADSRANEGSYLRTAP